ncbi:MAG: FAD-dependent oxidoreductase [Candidatus Loosdrechtia sp.]|uniref:FAD-dependent oxidoreductase n=1 Tax=Candidatus Loosdrechtia sp. TaxID=3101272 RepID=UPI00403AB0E8
MPPLTHPAKPVSIHLPPRSATVAAETDVLVIGGGMAGLGAALGAVAAGARVVLAERYGFLGGHATAGLVMPFASCYTEHPIHEKRGSVTLFPTDHGSGVPVVAGVFMIFLEQLVKAGGAVPPSPETGYTVPFDPEIFKSVAMNMLDEAGVHFLFHALASDIIHNQEKRGVVFETKSGPIIITAHVVIDCTGDGDVAAKAGARYEIGRIQDGLTQPATLMFRIVGFEQEAFKAYVRDHPDQWYGVHGLWSLIQKASDAGELELPREDILFFGTPHEREIGVNCTRITQMLGIDVWDLTHAEREGRRQMHQIFQFLQRYVPGFEKAYIVQSGVNVGIRETRRILGEYQLTVDDVLQARIFDDVIARCAYPIDIHNPKGKGTEFRKLPAGKAYDIPLRCLLPQDIEGIIVAGRCISGTHEAHSSYRIMPVAMATGQAAGACAALASRMKITPKIVPVPDVQEELLRQGANLGNVR